MAEFYTISTRTEDPAGIKIIENPTKTLKAVLFPREYLAEFNKLEKSGQAGVYILYNTIDKNEQPHIYIGQTGYNITSRLNSHNKNKDFWNQALVFVEKGAEFLNLNAAHAKIMESILIEEAGKCGAVVMDNSTGSRAPRVQPADRISAQTWANEVMTITKMIGLAFFINQGTSSDDVGGSSDQGSAGTGNHGGSAPYNQGDSQNIIPDGIYTMDRKNRASGKTYHGIMEVRSGKYYLKSGSELIPDVRPSLSAGHVALRKNLKVKKGKLLEDVELQSPSACGQIFIGAACNGWSDWKNEEGEAIDVYRRK